jgi:integrase
MEVRMAARSTRSPSYRLHNPTGQAVVTLSGADVYRGTYNSIESREAYDRAISEWLAGGRQPVWSDGLTINELVARFMVWASGYYRKNGKVTGEVENIRHAIKTLRRLYGSTEAAEFGPLSLKAVRVAYIAADLGRNEVNRRTGIVVRAFKWGVAEGIVPSSVHHGSRAVTGLRRGRSQARESERIKPVPEGAVDATLPFLAKPVAAIVGVMLPTGARPGEACIVRACDLNMAGAVWEFRPSVHKTEHHDRERVILLGPKAQAIVREWLRPDVKHYLISPRNSVAEKLAERRKECETKLWPSHLAHQAEKRKPDQKRKPEEHYDAGSSSRLGSGRGALRPAWWPGRRAYLVRGEGGNGWTRPGRPVIIPITRMFFTPWNSAPRLEHAETSFFCTSRPCRRRQRRYSRQSRLSLQIVGARSRPSP